MRDQDRPELYARPKTEELWSIACGCDQHGDHLGCEERCKEEETGCAHPLTLEVVAYTEEVADKWSGRFPEWVEVDGKGRAYALE